ncbi:hypothetical protein N9C35_03005 [Flavobacteriaceae bacterium]|nr:hypothetical protein [Flavobacteriaceae bacterium]
MKKFIITILLLTSSCRWFSDAGLPFLAGTNIALPEGSPNFKKGFKDGCSSALYSRGNTYYRMKYKFEYDHDLINDADYKFGNQRGYSYCFAYIVSYGAEGGIDAYFVPSGGLSPLNYDDKGSLNDVINQGDPVNLERYTKTDGLNSVFHGFTKTGNSGGTGAGGILGSHPFFGTPSKSIFSW